MSVKLKIKIKSLAEEARIIRKEEIKAKFRKDNNLRESLYEHRTWSVRRAARNTQIAYGYIRGKSYRQIENKANSEPDWKSVYDMVRKYDPSFDTTDKKAHTDVYHDIKDWFRKEE